MLRVGITGGIGSGKSIVSKILTTLGYPVFNSDSEAKLIMVRSDEVRAELIALFGPEAYSGSELNRHHIANMIFADDSLRYALNEIVHPATRKEFERFCDLNTHSKIVFNEAAILFETGAYKNFDKTLLVTAPIELRIKRVSKRDGISEEAVYDRIKSQWSDQEKVKLADFVIDNSEEKPMLIEVEKILNLLP